MQGYSWAGREIVSWRSLNPLSIIVLTVTLSGEQQRPLEKLGSHIPLLLKEEAGSPALPQAAS